MKKTIAVVASTLACTLAATSHAAAASDCAAIESRLIVFGDVDNLRKSNEGPLKRPLLKFVAMLTDEVVKDVYDANVYASRYIPDADEQANLAVILNAADANKLVQVTLAAGPEPLKDPHFVLTVTLAEMSRAAAYQPNRPAFTNSAKLWERSFRLDPKDELEETAKRFARQASDDMLPLLRR